MDPATEKEQKSPVPEPRPAAEPALANLDTHRDDAPPRHAGSAAAGALDRLGVAGPPRHDEPEDPEPAHTPPEERPAVLPEIPAQGGPVDEPAKRPTDNGC